ncbi:acyl-CoA dehydrogenase family protein [Reinekea blandensis]|uniref:Acyl-CoA dehydrogenase n=1 Tax=Reinekea blandensis MED297 TaxID=314283 RepID=A4BGE5_9GAMM|nr:acyl-CoA dehydrogenase family protein [Reinekea blandensis]EAR08751.1 Acyl-CoA dehydrogenase [Reinekea sp. MED297] [Reinekea blandensis MED297]
MATFPTAERLAAETHTVENTPPLLENINLFDSDLTLLECLDRGQAGWASGQLSELGAIVGSAERLQAAMEANRVRPALATHDRYGHRIDEVTFHPGYHDFMTLSKANGLTGSPWEKAQPGAHVARAAGSYLVSQVEAGHCCPITMTFASVPTLLKQPDIADEWIPKILNRAYEPGNVPYFEKQSVTIGMAMTEKQGGSDVRANSTRAEAIDPESPKDGFELIGHKFFASAPMCDAFLVLAYTDVGLSCFLVPRWRPDGSKNPIQFLRLKDKMGNVSNASSEIELRGAFGWLIGEEGRGVANILEMVALTRFDCLVSSAAAMRQHMTQILHHTQHRAAFGKKLIDQPLMRNLLADLELEAEAATLLAFRVAQALDGQAQGHRDEGAFARLATAIGKYWVCKRQPNHAYEAMETIGGSGVMENSVMPRLYRDAPINTIWEGSGNVQCLDALRAIQRDPDSLAAVMAEIELAKGLNAHFDDHLQGLQQQLTQTEDLEFRARSLVQSLALALQASLMLRHMPTSHAHAFCDARFHAHGLTYGLLPPGTDCEAILERGRHLT